MWPKVKIAFVNHILRQNLQNPTIDSKNESYE